MSPVRAKVTRTGDLVLPAELRRAVGLEHGGNVVVELDGREIRIRTLTDVVARAQQLSKKLLSGHSSSTVHGFLAERRREAQID